MSKKDSILSVLYDSRDEMQKEIKEKENLLDDLEWDLRVTKERIEYLKVKLKDVKEHIEDITKNF